MIIFCICNFYLICFMGSRIIIAGGALLNMTKKERLLMRLGGNIVFAGCVLYTAGICIFLYQIFFWLKYDSWHRLPIDLIFTFLPQTCWLKTPRYWYTFHTILVWFMMHIPLSFFLIVAGMAISNYGNDLDVKMKA